MSGRNIENYPYYKPGVIVRSSDVNEWMYRGVIEAIRVGYVATLDEIAGEFAKYDETQFSIERWIKSFVSYISEGRCYNMFSVPIGVDLYTNSSSQPTLLFYNWELAQTSDLQRSMQEAMARPIGEHIAPERIRSLLPTLERPLTRYGRVSLTRRTAAG